MKYYAGIGARETPGEICLIMTQIARWLAEESWVLRSGGAVGADIAFEQGCDLANGNKEIFLPQKAYNKHTSILYTPPKSAYDLIDTLWGDLLHRSQLVRSLFARNCQQILGADLNSPCNLVICWTRDGKDTGGTGKAIEIARKFNIPVTNLYNYRGLEKLDKNSSLSILTGLTRNG